MELPPEICCYPTGKQGARKNMTETQSSRIRQALPKLTELNNSSVLKVSKGGFLPFLFMLPFQIAQEQAQKQAIQNQIKAQNGGK